MFDRFQNYYIREEDIMYIRADLISNFIFVAVCYSNAPKVFRYDSRNDLLEDMKYFKNEEQWTVFDKLDDLTYINSNYLHQFILDKNSDGVETISFCFKSNNCISYLDEIEINENIKEFIEDII